MLGGYCKNKKKKRRSIIEKKKNKNKNTKKKRKKERTKKERRERREKEETYSPHQISGTPHQFSIFKRNNKQLIFESPCLSLIHRHLLASLSMNLNPR